MYCKSKTLLHDIEIDDFAVMQIEFEDGMEKTIEWYKNNKNWWMPIRKKMMGYYKKQYVKR